MGIAELMSMIKPMLTKAIESNIGKGFDFKKYISDQFNAKKIMEKELSKQNVSGNISNLAPDSSLLTAQIEGAATTQGAPAIAPQQNINDQELKEQEARRFALKNYLMNK